MSTKKKAAVKKSVSNEADTRKITLLVKENPKREGSASHKRFELYKKHKTVEAFLKAGGTAADIRWDTAAKFVSVG